MLVFKQKISAQAIVSHLQTAVSAIDYLQMFGLVSFVFLTHRSNNTTHNNPTRTDLKTSNYNCTSIKSADKSATSPLTRMLVL